MFKTRGPVVRLHRSQKARMVEAFLTDELGGPIVGKGILDIGCGNGGISEYFAERNDVTGVDIKDQRWEQHTSFVFKLLETSALPFPDAMFDIVLSHHVIEHVPDQKQHLAEMNRVLKPDGVAYLGTPNRSSPIMEGHVGNNLVLRYSEMIPLFERAGFAPVCVSEKLISQPAAYSGEIRWGRWLPRPLVRLLMPWCPSHYFIFRKL